MKIDPTSVVLSNTLDALWLLPPGALFIPSTQTVPDPLATEPGQTYFVKMRGAMTPNLPVEMVDVVTGQKYVAGHGLITVRRVTSCSLVS